MDEDYKHYIDQMPEGNPTEETAYRFLKNLHLLPFHAVEGTMWERPHRIKRVYPNIPDELFIKFVDNALKSGLPTLDTKYCSTDQNETTTKSGVQHNVHTMVERGGENPPPILITWIEEHDEEADCCDCPDHRS